MLKFWRKRPEEKTGKPPALCRKGCSPVLTALEAWPRVNPQLPKKSSGAVWRWMSVVRTKLRLDAAPSMSAYFVWRCAQRCFQFDTQACGQIKKPSPHGLGVGIGLLDRFEYLWRIVLNHGNRLG